ncbi:putative enzyme related to lactoylglutathione lyase [Kribbella voronezhensis]|uniref:Putative enzyme related to lactoylglutathione lyase n=1 Tax=Kribbella voronezhensis TaxID=2512212 RepID=A0A4R7TD62_9ACTN|nr:VOC family protein [Kribbella voronezhensis]TDU90015.1 putative enzyme related to lactoylglutathione lyase [Kribbella voronezhensis]
MDKPVLNSLLLGSTDPERLKKWYVDGFHAEVNGYGNLDLGGFVMVIEKRDDVAAATVEPGRVVLNFAVEDIEAAAAHLRTLAVDWLVEPEDRGVGWFATLVDPDGNYVQLIQMKPEYYANL